MKQSALSLVVAAVALLLASGIAVRVVADADWDVTVLAAFGEDDHSTRTYAEERLGEVFLRSDLGHDGRFFFVQSNDPWVTDPAENIDVVDRPLYRSQRMLYPVLAGGGGLLNAEAIIWSMIIVNVIAMGLGSWAVAQVAIEMGGSPWWGLAFVLNIGFISEMTIGAAGVVAGAAAFGSVALWMKDRTGWAVTLMTLAVLSREAMLVAALGTSWYLWKRGERRQAILATAVPATAATMWALYIRLRIGGGAGVDQVEEIGLPFVGFAKAYGSWLGNPVDLAVALAMMLLFLLFVRRVLLSGELVGWAFVGFVALAILFTEQVWVSYFNITRAIAPVITAFVLLVFALSGAEEHR